MRVNGGLTQHTRRVDIHVRNDTECVVVVALYLTRQVECLQ